MKKIAILGSTGSIGRSTLRVLEALDGNFSVSTLSCLNNTALLKEQIRKFSPKFVSVGTEEGRKEILREFPSLEVATGKEGLINAACHESVDLVVSALSGAVGLEPTYCAIEAGKDIALANKEALVSAGSLLMQEVKRRGVALLPIDSEHSAIFQCLEGNKIEDVGRLILTASGGPFRDTPLPELKNKTLEDALCHPTWSMGVKNTIDSATLMNKGLEVIEASYLFGIPSEKIAVVIHPESFVHSMVEFKDGSLLMQASYPDMTLPIQYAITYPKRYPSPIKLFDLKRPHAFHFFPPDLKKFKALALSFAALEEGGGAPCFLNGAAEVLTQKFIERRIPFLEIGEKLTYAMDRYCSCSPSSIDEVLELDKRAREIANKL